MPFFSQAFVVRARLAENVRSFIILILQIVHSGLLSVVVVFVDTRAVVREK